MGKVNNIVLSLSLTAALIGNGASFAAAEKTDRLVPVQSLVKDHLKADDKVNLQSFQTSKQSDEHSLVIKYKESLPASLHQKAGVTIKKRLASLKYDIVTYSSKADISKIIKTYESDKNVLSIQKSVPYKMLETNDPKLSKMSHLNQIQTVSTSNSTGKSAVTVAVIDSGVDASHPDLKANLLPGINIVDPARKSIPDMHGTHVAGIIAAAENNGIGGKGVNPQAKILPIDVFNGSEFAYDYAIAEGILYAIENKAKVINMSLGSYYPSPIIQEAVQDALEYGITVVAAAGNSGSSEPEYPASFDGVISVGAVDSSSKLAAFSSYGPSVDVVAPGENIYSTAYDGGKKSTFRQLSGTSMASPMVAGAASLLLAKDPELTPFQVEMMLESTTRDLGAAGYDTRYGYGLVDIKSALAFDKTKLPAQSIIHQNSVLSVAESINLTGMKYEASSSFVKPYEKHWRKLEVNPGDYLQFTLGGSENYDYQLDLLFYPEGSRQPYDILAINDVSNGANEGHLYEALEKGTLVIGVKDAFGHFGAGKQSSYTLKIDASNQLLTDNNDKNSTVQMKLPFQLNTPHYLSNAEGGSDQDYYHFNVDQAQVVNVDLSAVPGVDPSVRVYMHSGTEWTEEDILMEGNLRGIGYGETFSFEALPDVSYTLEVTNESFFDEDDWFLNDYEYVSFGGISSSHIPYQLAVRGKVLPEDVDGFPKNLWNTEDGISESEIETYRQTVQQKALNPVEKLTEEEDISEGDSLSSLSTLLTLDKKENEYIQYMDDIDLYRFTAESSGVYNLNVSEAGDFQPALEVYTQDAMTGEWLLAAANYFGFGKSDLQIGLTEGETYLIMIGNQYFQPSIEPYDVSMEVEYLFTGAGDIFEPNDDPGFPTIIDEGTFTGDFSKLNDTDFYYVEPGQTGLFSIGAVPAPETLPADIPGSLRSAIDPVLLVIEDSDGNGYLDYDEYEKVLAYDKGYGNESEVASIKRKAESGYFLALFNYDFGGPATLTPYKLHFKQIKIQDEDKDSKIVENVPQKPLQLKLNGDKHQAKGYFQYLTGSDTDIDWYSLNTWKKTNVVITLDTSYGTDGVIKVFNKQGKLIKESDLYGENDAEQLDLSLTESGPYYIAVQDSASNPSAEPYQLTISTAPLKGTERIGGKDRYDTSFQFSSRIPDHSLNTVILASGSNYPDALTGNVLNKIRNGTTLLINDDKAVMAKAVQEAKRLLRDNGKVVILGGKQAVSATVEKEFKKHFEVLRIAGTNRTDTSIEIAKKVTSKPGEIFLTSGSSFSDALSIGVYATEKQIPILLTDSADAPSASLVSYLKENSIKKVTIIGGENVVSPKLVSELKSKGVMDIKRISGKDRYETSVKVAETFYPAGKGAALASGKVFPDALSGSHLAYYQQIPIILTDGKSVGSAASAYLSKTTKESYYLYGGTNVMEASVEKGLPE
ncbi:S8 family serine peptidase [Bacillus salacetis]|uniref:S8 family serine peptidase n=1 Tax=Bacillus salacetis TaxID=2315464 RepID=UPI003B9DFA8C